MATQLTELLDNCLSADLIDWASDLTVALKDVNDAAKQNDRGAFIRQMMELRAILHNLEEETGVIMEQFKPGNPNPLQ